MNGLAFNHQWLQKLVLHKIDFQTLAPNENKLSQPFKAYFVFSGCQVTHPVPVRSRVPSLHLLYHYTPGDSCSLADCWYSAFCSPLTHTQKKQNCVPLSHNFGMHVTFHLLHSASLPQHHTGSHTHEWTWFDSGTVVGAALITWTCDPQWVQRSFVTLSLTGTRKKPNFHFSDNLESAVLT